MRNLGKVLKASIFFVTLSAILYSPVATAGEIEELKAQVQMLMDRVAVLEARLQERPVKLKPTKKLQPAVLEAKTETSKIEHLADQSEILETKLQEKSEKPISLGIEQPIIQTTKIEAAKTEHPVESGNDRVKLTLSGHINRAVLFADNGFDSRFFHVDNDALSSRFSLDGTAKINDDFTIGTNLLIQVESNSSFDVDIGKDPPSSSSSNLSDRRVQFYFDSKTFGRLWVGKGETASDDINEIDLSGTDVVSIGASAELMAGGVSFRSKSDPSTQGPRIKEVWDPMDGLGRADRLRYDSPNLYGFILGGSHGDGDRSDISLKFAGEFDATRVQAGLAMGNIPGVFRQYNGAIAVLFPVGISISGAWGIQEPKSNSGRRHVNLGHGKLGYQHKWFDWGNTAFAVDYGECRDLAKSGDKMTTYGIFLVQHLDFIATELYWGVRWHDLDRKGDDFKKITASMLGGKIKF